MSENKKFCLNKEIIEKPLITPKSESENTSKENIYKTVEHKNRTNECLCILGNLYTIPYSRYVISSVI